MISLIWRHAKSIFLIAGFLFETLGIRCSEN